jgi:hypothetical protein
MKLPKDDTARKLDAAVERLGVKLGSKKRDGRDYNTKGRRACAKLGLRFGQIYGLGLIDEETF